VRPHRYCVRCQALQNQHASDVPFVGIRGAPIITLDEIAEVFIDDGGDLALALHESIWDGFREDLSQGSTRNRVKPLLAEYFEDGESPLTRPSALHWDRHVILPYAGKKWPHHIAFLRERWPGSVRRHPPVTRLAILLWLEWLYDPDLGNTTLTDLHDLFPKSSTEEIRRAEYQRHCRGLLQWKVPDTVTQAVSTRIRSARARKAVLCRDEYQCKNPHCTGQPNDVNDLGRPLLHVDHILDLGSYGPDDPRNMIALCPNCHEVKTLGTSRYQLSKELAEIARQRHALIFGE
jgi:hypothetical protein